MKYIKAVFYFFTERLFLFILGIMIAIVGLISPMRAFYGLYKVGEEMKSIFAPNKKSRLSAKDIMSCKDC